MKRFWHNNSLSIVLFTIFFITLALMSVAGWKNANEESAEHGASSESYSAYVVSGDFIEGVFENWESEFLQMFALVILTVFLRQKGSDESKPMKGKIPQETASRYSFWRAGDWSGRIKAARHGVYAHSLSLTLFAIFIVSLLLHAYGGAMAYNEEALRHQQPTVGTFSYMGTSRFWYESMQNWQSEFLAVGALILLSIHLRERGSPQSKPVGISYNHSTGS
jgi:hypothetical protein